MTCVGVFWICVDGFVSGFLGWIDLRLIFCVLSWFILGLWGLLGLLSCGFGYFGFCAAVNFGVLVIWLVRYLLCDLLICGLFVGVCVCVYCFWDFLFGLLIAVPVMCCSVLFGVILSGWLVFDWLFVVLVWFACLRSVVIAWVWCVVWFVFVVVVLVDLLVSWGLYLFVSVYLWDLG